jgi:hypothetical protein
MTLARYPTNGRRTFACVTTHSSTPRFTRRTIRYRPAARAFSTHWNRCTAHTRDAADVHHNPQRMRRNGYVPLVPPALMIGLLSNRKGPSCDERRPKKTQVCQERRPRTTDSWQLQCTWEPGVVLKKRLGSTARRPQTRRHLTSEGKRIEGRSTNGTPYRSTTIARPATTPDTSHLKRASQTNAMLADIRPRRIPGTRRGEGSIYSLLYM